MSASLKLARAARGGVRPSARIVRGDPGLLGAIGGGIIGLATGGITGAVAGAVKGWNPAPAAPAVLRSASGSGPMTMALPSPTSIPIPAPVSGGGIPVVPTPGLTGLAQRLVPGGATGYEVPASAAGLGVRAPSGYHVNKSGYFLKSGEYVAPGSRYVKNRRRNPLNPRALRRAIERIDMGKSWQGKLREISTAKFTAAGTKKDK